MPSRVVNKYIDVGQREVILWTRLIEILLVDTNPDAAVFLWHGHYIRKLRRIVYDHNEANFELFDHLFFDLEAPFWL